MIQFHEISKLYGEFAALQDLNLTLEDGEIFGLIGHNGAGKTTTISLLTSIIEPSSGHISIDGLELSQHREELKKRMTYVPDSPDLFLNLTAREYWQFLATIYGVDKSIADMRVEELVHLFDMVEHQYETIDSYSHGMRQKAMVIGSLIPDPAIWILDEPLTGLDPQASFDLKETMKKEAKKGKTVLFSTHVLSVAEQLCNRIGILRKGQLIFVGTLEDLKAHYPNKDLETIYLELAGRQTEAKAGDEV